MPDYDYEKICLCALNMLFGFRPSLIYALIDSLGSAKAVFDLDEDGKEEIFGPYSEIRKKIDSEDVLEKARKEMEEAKRRGCLCIGFQDPEYPLLLSECEDRPCFLYVKSAVPLEQVFCERKYIAFVGTRDVSQYGKDWCKKLIKFIGRADRQACIVSGFAYGVDIIAHQAAFDEGLFTIAVLPTGLDTVYPRHHYQFAERLVSQGRGVLISDYPFRSPAIKANFVRRNRIIAGLSQATVLIESKIKGGGLITCEQAFSYDRDVFALPGRVDDVRSAGCNMLIRTGVAMPIVSEQNFIGTLGYKFGHEGAAEPDIEEIYAGKLALEQVEALAAIYKAVRGAGQGAESGAGRSAGAGAGFSAESGARCGSGLMSTDEIAEKTGLSFAAVSAMAGILAADGYLDMDFMGNCSIKR